MSNIIQIGVKYFLFPPLSAYCRLYCLWWGSQSPILPTQLPHGPCSSSCYLTEKYCIFQTACHSLVKIIEIFYMGFPMQEKHLVCLHAIQTSLPLIKIWLRYKLQTIFVALVWGKNVNNKIHFLEDWNTDIQKQKIWNLKMPSIPTSVSSHLKSYELPRKSCRTEIRKNQFAKFLS